MSSGERAIGTAKGKQPNTEALCQPPPPLYGGPGGGRQTHSRRVAAFGAALTAALCPLAVLGWGRPYPLHLVDSAPSRPQYTAFDMPRFAASSWPTSPGRVHAEAMIVSCQRFSATD